MRRPNATLLLRVSLSFMVLAATTGNGSTAFAAPPASGYRPSARGSICLLEAFEALSGVKPVGGLERTAELEIPAALVWPHLTTTDGTLAPLVAHYGGSTEEARGSGWYSELFGDRDPANVRWDSLSREQQQRVLDGATRTQNFNADRVIHGLKISQEGSHPLSGFQPYVEMADSSDAGAVKGFELHYRAQASASDSALAARKASRALGRERQHLHVHVPMKLDSDALRANPLLETARTMDFYRRSELFAQMMTVMETNVNLTDNGLSFLALNHRYFQKVAMEFLSAGAEARTVGREALSKGYIGIRGESFYDQPGLWGLEVRAIHRSLPDSEMKALLDGIELTGARSGFGLPEGRIENWMVAQGIEAPETGWGRKAAGFGDYPFAVESAAQKLSARMLPPTHAGRVAADALFTGERTQQGAALLDQWLAGYKGGNFGSAGSKRYERIDRALEKNPSFKFFLQDWSYDPLFHDNPQALERIELARLAVLRKLIRGEKEQLVMREFIVDSGLYQAFGESIGIRVQTLEP